MGFVLEETTISDIHQAFCAGTLTCASLTRRYLDRIAAYDQKGPALNAFVCINAKATAEAEQVDAAFAKDKKLRGLLHGIPVAVKDQAGDSRNRDEFRFNRAQGLRPATGRHDCH